MLVALIGHPVSFNTTVGGDGVVFLKDICSTRRYVLG